VVDVIAVTSCYALEVRWMKRSSNILVLRTPIGAHASEGLDEAVAGEDVSMVVSTGFCGGLEQGLRTGDLVLADAVRFEGEEIPVSPSLVAAAREALERDAGRRTRVGACEGTSDVATAMRKRDLAETGALSVDMESGPLALWAKTRDLPFLSLRVILDPPDEELPFGTSASVASSFVRHPVRSLRTARSAFLAGRTLGRALDDLLPVLEEGS
jgi:nucleoside phosphorylase